MRTVFPLGEREIKAGIEEVRQLLGGRCSEPECQKIYLGSKLDLFLATDRSPAAIIPKIIGHAEGRISAEDANRLYDRLGVPLDAMYGGGSGASQETAVIIGAPSEISGITAEYPFLQQVFGQRDADWSVVSRTSLTSLDHKSQFYLFRIRLKNQSERDVWFDITNIFAKI